MALQAGALGSKFFILIGSGEIAYDCTAPLHTYFSATLVHCKSV